MKPLHEAQLSKLIKMDSSEIDVYDTGMFCSSTCL